MALFTLEVTPPCRSASMRTSAAVLTFPKKGIALDHATAFIENKTYDEINVGDSASLQRTLTPRDIQLFAVMSGDVNPAHVDPEYAKSSLFHEVIAHGMWGGSLISTVLGTHLPGPGHGLHRPVAAFLASGDARRHDHRERDGEGKIRAHAARDPRLHMHQPGRPHRDPRHGRGARADRESQAPPRAAPGSAPARHRGALPASHRAQQGARRRSTWRWCIPAIANRSAARFRPPRPGSSGRC